MRDHDGPGYSTETVDRLLGRGEAPGEHGHRDITIIDIISWARDPGVERFRYEEAWESGEQEAWTARRGPLAPDDELACLLYDFRRAMKRLPLQQQVIVALTVMGFSAEDIAAVLDLDAGTRSSRALESRRRRIAYILEGRPRKDAEGRDRRDEQGNVIRAPSVAARLARYMSGA